MGNDRDGMLPPGYVLPERHADPEPDWVHTLRTRLDAAGANYQLANSAEDELRSIIDAIRATLNALDDIDGGPDARRMMTRLLLALETLSAGQEDGLLTKAATRGRRGGRRQTLTQAIIVLATKSRIEFGESEAAADEGVARYAARRGITGHRGGLISKNTVRKWRLSLNARRDLDEVRAFVEPMLRALPRSMSLQQVRKHTEWQIEKLATDILQLKKIISPPSE